MPRLRLVNLLHRQFELAGAVVVFAALVWQAPSWSAQFVGNDGWSAAGLYTGVFTWAAIQAGALFAIYAFIVPKSEPFVKAVAATRHFEAFKLYMLRIVYVTFAVAIVAFVLTVANPKPSSDGIGRVLLPLWLAVSFYSFLAFLKVIRSFRKLDRTRKR